MALVVIAFVVVRTGGRVRTAADEASETLRELRPRAVRVLEQSENELGRIQAITEHVDDVASRVDSVTEQATDTVVPLLQDAKRLARSTDHVAAAVHGARVGMNALRRDHR